MKDDIKSLLFLSGIDLFLIFVIPLTFVLYGVIVSRKSNISNTDFGKAFLLAYIPIAILMVTVLILALDQRPKDLAISLVASKELSILCPNQISPVADGARVSYNEELMGCNFTIKFENQFLHYKSILSWLAFCFFSLVIGIFICDVTKLLRDFIVIEVFGKLKNVFK